MRKFAVIGLGRFGRDLAVALAAGRGEVIAIDRDIKPVEEIRDEVTLAVRMDSTDEEALKAQGIHEVDVAIVGIGTDFESAALTVATLKSLGVKRLIARAQNKIQAQILLRVGADETVLPERESALRWAHRLMLPNLKQYIELGEHHSLVYLVAPRRFHDKTLRELDLRNKYGVNLIAIERRKRTRDDKDGVSIDEPIVAVPGASTVIHPDDVLVLAGSNDSISALSGD
jgi:trk system potassium uptake protein TrkA